MSTQQKHSSADTWICGRRRNNALASRSGRLRRDGRTCVFRKVPLRG
jgi:hypothetical protein